MNKILIYYEQYGYGGVDTHLSTLINGWKNTEDKFFIITNSNNTGLDFLKKRIYNYNVIYKTISFKKNLNNTNNFITKILSHIRFKHTFSYNFRKIIDLYKPDHVIIDNGGYPGGITNWYAPLEAIKANIISNNIYILIHHSPVKIVKFNLFNLYVNYLIKLILKKSIRFVTVSLASKNKLQKLTPIKNICVIYNGIEKPKQKKSLFFLKNKWNVDDKKIIIGMIGPIQKHKGIENLIKIYNSSVYLKKYAKVIIIGKSDDNYSNLINKLIIELKLQKQILLTGYLEYKSYDLINLFDIFVMPTIDFEGFGYSMAEAMITKKPVVVSNVGAIPEIITNNIDGFIVEPFNYLDWKIKIEMLCKDKNLRSKLGLSAYEKISNKFSDKIMCEKYLELLNEF
tara:strand:- start:42282 stop:43475 length:1194 start_codon:yes stop_codon:yes gene_type:complete